MTRKERLMATLRGEPVDRPAVCFYELDGYTQDENNPDVFNVYNHPSWKPLLQLVREKTDRIVMCQVPFVRPASEVDKRTKIISYFDEEGRKHEVTELQADGCTLRKHTRRDREVDTEWILEHLIKNQEELEAWINLPDEELGMPDYRGVYDAEKNLGDSGIVMLDTEDAICALADLLGMENFMIFAMTEPELTERALDKIQAGLVKKVARIAADLPGYLWRIYGPEYACAPYLPPRLYEKYVVGYDKQFIDIIHKSGGYVRIHQHGRQRDILDYTVMTGCDGIDPIEPEPLGDISLLEVRKKYGRDLVLFGNLEIRDIELLPPEEFEKIVIRTIREGTFGEGRGFVLMPSASPLGRELAKNTLNNYRKIVEVMDGFAKAEL